MSMIPIGQEPANIKKRMDTLFAKLDGAYPDKVIRSLGKDHKKWAETVTELYRALGYPNGDAFLEAYGYTVEKGKSGRPSGNPTDVIDELRRRYPNGASFRTVSALEQKNPDLKGKLKTLQNNAHTLLGMGLKEYLLNIGMLGSGKSENETGQEMSADELIAVLKTRYTDESQLPPTIFELKRQNADLPMEKLNDIEKGEMTIWDYLRKEKLLAERVKAKPASNKISTQQEFDAYLNLLKEHYSEEFDRPETVKQLIGTNPEVPVVRMNRYLWAHGIEDVAEFYIQNGVLAAPKEYPFCLVQLLSGGTLWGLSKVDDVNVGDRVAVEYRGKRQEGQVLQSCMFTKKTAPYKPESVTVFILEVMEKNTSLIKVGGHPPMTERFREVAAAKQIPAAYKKQVRHPIDLRKKDRWGQDDYYLAQLHFKGYVSEMRKLWEFLDEKGKTGYRCMLAEEGVAELVIDADVLSDWQNEVYIEAMQKFPTLKVAGLAEVWSQGKVLSFYSESGADEITHHCPCGPFDGKDDGLDGRWAHNMKSMMEPYRGTYVDLRTGITVKIGYRFPWEKQWDDNVYYYEIDGVLYEE